MDHCGRVGATWEHVMTIEFMSLSSILEVFTWLTFMCLWLPMSIMLGKWEQTQHRWDALANMGSSTQALLKTLATVQSSSIPSITSTVALHATAKLWLDKSSLRSIQNGSNCSIQRDGRNMRQSPSVLPTLGSFGVKSQHPFSCLFHLLWFVGPLGSLPRLNHSSCLEHIWGSSTLSLVFSMKR